MAPRWVFTEHMHHGLEVVGVVRGAVQLQAAGKNWSIGAHQVVALPPYLPHGWYADVGATLNVLHMVYAPRDLTQRLVPGAQPRLLTLPEPQFAEYDTLFSRLAALGNQATPQQVRLLRAYLEAFLLTLLDGEQDATLIAAHEVASYMQAHLTEPLTIAQLAQHFSISEVTLRRRFHSAFAVSPKRYLLDIRLCEAQHLLATTQLSIRAIAAQLGFFDLAHFSSTFRLHFGLSPSEWRAREQHPTLNA